LSLKANTHFNLEKEERLQMLLENLIKLFHLEKKRNPSHVNELLDYIQKGYIYGELSIVEYKKLFSELDKRNAEKPQNYLIKTSPLETYHISS
jgi:hypothetical protein